MYPIVRLLSSRWTCSRHGLDRLLPQPMQPFQRKLSDAIQATTDLTEKTAEIPKEEKEGKKVDPHKVVLRKRYAHNPAPLMEFFDDINNWGEKKVRSGREWKIEELRIKSNEDLHKLWYVLLKERNMLMTMKDQAKDQLELFPSPERLDRVEQSMINLENVVRERNKAYMELEVGEGETAERPGRFRRDLFGIHRYVKCSEHIIPYWMNTKWRKLYGPGHDKYVSMFIERLREKKALKNARHTLEQWYEVRQLLRRFPDIDLEVLQEKYPKVPVKYFKENLDYYTERWHFSQYSLDEWRNDKFQTHRVPKGTTN